MKKVSDIMRARNTIKAYVKETLLESSISSDSDLAAFVEDRGDEVVAIVYDGAYYIRVLAPGGIVGTVHDSGVTQV